MPDQEKAIKALENLNFRLQASGNAYDSWAVQEALFVLRQQVPVKMKEYEKNIYRCTRCGNYVKVEFDKRSACKYCPTCGKAVKWDD